MGRFLGNLSEIQRHNFQNIVMCHRFFSFRPDLERPLAFATERSKWTSCFRRQAGFPSLRSLKTLELHLSLCRRMDGTNYLRAFQTHLKAFEPLRLLSLDDASVTLSVVERRGRKALDLIHLEDEEMRSLTKTFQDRLLNPMITKQDIANTLQDEIENLDYSVRTSGSNVKALLHQVAEVHKEADQLQAQAAQQQRKLDEDRDQLQRLHAVIGRGDSVEMSKEIQLRTGEYLELSGRDGENVAEL